MKKAQAIQLLGGSVSAAASVMGITYQAVDKWPEELPPRIAERVIGAWAIREVPDVIAKAMPDSPAPAEQGAGAYPTRKA